MAVAQSAQLLERDDYLAELAEIVARSAPSSGRFVIVKGPAGIGKTRLLQALGAGCEPASTTVPTARGRRWLRTHRRGGWARLAIRSVLGAASAWRRYESGELVALPRGPVRLGYRIDCRMGELARRLDEPCGLRGLRPEARALRAELQAARERTRRPVAVNLLLPFARRAHFTAAGEADAVITFWGRPRRRTPGLWLHQCGSVDEARAAHAAGADGVIAQGVEAGGHVRGATPALELLAQVRASLPEGSPCWWRAALPTAATWTPRSRPARMPRCSGRASS